MDNVEKKIEKVLSKVGKDYELPDDFTSRIMRKIRAKELIKIKFGWIHASVITFFSILSFVLLVLMLDDSVAAFLLNAAPWYVGLLVLFVLIQWIDSRLVKRKS